MSTAPDTAAQLGYRLKLAQHALQLRMEDALRPYDLTLAQYAVLAGLADQPDRTNADLAKAAFTTPQSMQGVLAKLEARTLVERRPAADHGRRPLARLTPSGRALLDKARRAASQVEQRLVDAVAPLGAEQAIALFERLHAALADPAR